ncbi:MAG: choloylglycine hydrolase family protein [Nitrospirae bacterium]|nr:choloylglycine hydrolase family protein [Nitrospirota bacterium]
MKELLAIIAVAVVLLSQPAFACTDIQLTAKDGTVLVGRTLEWEGFVKKAADGTSYIYNQFDYALRVWPAGVKTTSLRPDGTPGVSWTSKYAYFGFVGNKASTDVSDGQNSAGLSLEVLYFPGYAEYQDAKPSDKNVMSTDDFGTWLLGNFASVDDIKRELPKMTVWGKPNQVMLNQIPQLHFVLHDKTGKSIIIEYTKKQLHIYDNDVKVMTNSPDYAWMSNNLNNYVNLSPDNVVRAFGDARLKPFGQGTGMIGIPGDYTPPSRFVKAAYLVFFAKQPDTAKEGVRSIIHILNNVDIPFGSVRDKMSDGNYAQDYTLWKVIKDLTHGIWYIDTYQNVGSIVKIDLNDAFANPTQYLKPVALSEIPYPDVPKINDLLKN